MSEHTSGEADSGAGDDLRNDSGTFDAPSCPRCGGPSSGSRERGQGMASKFDNYVIMCPRCLRRSEERAAVILAADSEETTARRALGARTAALKSWLGSRPGD